MAESDAVLVEQVRAGDTDAFAELYRLHVGTVVHVVRDHVHTPEAVADVVQEVFTRALEALPRLRDGERFRPWLLSIARHAAVDQRRMRARTSTADAELFDAIADSAPGPDVLAEVRELVNLVQGQLSGLSERDANALLLVGQLGFSPDELGSAFGMSSGAAKVMVHRARRRLREALVIQLLVKRRGSGCEVLVDLHDGGDVHASGRHIRSCQICSSVATSDVELFQAAPAR